MITIVSVKKSELSKRGIKDFKEWQSKPDTLYIGRNMSHYVPEAIGSKWRNPFPVKKYSRDECLRLYEQHVRGSDLYNQLNELEGKELGCWCKPEGCHGDILIKLYNEKYS